MTYFSTNLPFADKRERRVNRVLWRRSLGTFLERVSLRSLVYAVFPGPLSVKGTSDALIRDERPIVGNQKRTLCPIAPNFFEVKFNAAVVSRSAEVPADVDSRFVTALDDASRCRDPIPDVMVARCFIWGREVVSIKWRRDDPLSSGRAVLDSIRSNLLRQLRERPSTVRSVAVKLNRRKT